MFLEAKAFPALDYALFSFCAALVFALVNLYTVRLYGVTEQHKRWALSFFGGVVAAYVFLDLLPSLEEAGVYLHQVSWGSLLVTAYEDAIFLVVFVGFLVFFVLEHFAKQSRLKSQALTRQHYTQIAADKRVFIVHFANFALMNLVLSYLLLFEFQAGVAAGLLFTFAVSLHLFISNDSMIEHYKHYQVGKGRYVGALIPLIGWAASMLFPEHLAEVYILLAFISGTVLYYSIKNELPSAAKKQSLALFLVGAFFYTVLLLVHSFLVA